MIFLFDVCFFFSLVFVFFVGRILYQSNVPPKEEQIYRQTVDGQRGKHVPLRSEKFDARLPLSVGNVARHFLGEPVLVIIIIPCNELVDAIL